MTRSFLWTLAPFVIGCTHGSDYVDLGAASGMETDQDPRDAAAPRDEVIDAGSDGALPVEPGGSCRSRADCAGGQLLCVGPEERACGLASREECEFNSDCVDMLDGRCHATADACSPDGIGSLCEEGPCTPTSCGVGFICQNGGCVPQRCNEGFACLPFEECDPRSIDDTGPAHALTHGCVPIACTTDEACPEPAVCVNDRCQTGLGTCSLPPP
jgi:hypothetical protein